MWFEEGGIQGLRREKTLKELSQEFESENLLGKLECQAALRGHLRSMEVNIERIESQRSRQGAVVLITDHETIN